MQNDGHTFIVRQLKAEMHTEYRLIFFIKKVRLSVAKLKKMHMILFDHKLQQAIAKEKESAAAMRMAMSSGVKSKPGGHLYAAAS